MIERHCVLFARTPRLGRVKTRLAADIGAIHALRFYRRQLARTAAAIGRDPRWRGWLAVTPDRDAGRAAGGLPGDLARLPQGAGDLGQRMARLLRSLPPGPAVIVGSDIPGLGPGHLRDAFTALGRADAVVGPGVDGGYWLFGFKRVRPVPRGLFDGVRWSGAEALADTLASLPADYRVERLTMLADVDDGDDYRAMRGIL